MHLFRGGGWGKAGFFFVMEDDVSKLILIIFVTSSASNIGLKQRKSLGIAKVQSLSFVE